MKDIIQLIQSRLMREQSNPQGDTEAVLVELLDAAKAMRDRSATPVAGRCFVPEGREGSVVAPGVDRWWASMACAQARRMSEARVAAFLIERESISGQSSSSYVFKFIPETRPDAS